MGGPQVHVMNQQVQRETGRKAQLSNIAAGKAVSDIIRTTLGPRSMLKVILCNGQNVGKERFSHIAC